MTIFDTSTLTLLLLLVFLALTLGSAVGWIIFAIRSERLPAATRLVDVEQRLAIAQEALDRKQLELREMDQKIADRHRLAAESAALREQIDELNAQLRALEPARQDIAATLDDAAEAAGKLEAVRTELADKQAEIEKLNRDLDPERIARLRDEQEKAQSELARVLESLEPLRAERDAALRVIAEAAQVTSRIEMLNLQEQELQRRIERLNEDADDLAGEVEDLKQDVQGLEQQRQAAQTALAAAEAKHTDLVNEEQQLETRIATLKDDLKEALGSIRGLATGKPAPGPITEAEIKELLADLVAQPACLAAPARLRPGGAATTENQALHRVRTHLQAGGLVFSNRVLNAFHTALKINDSAQITVLAGVSGTGKSLLPRRYAEAMGIHFLQVAVEPRWDSPQDLLGFYNYVEGKYRATELARLMANMDPWQSFGSEAINHRDRLAMVLLDEMNLARVEYYFSEFLSRLEVRPPYAAGWPSRAACKDALIPVDIRGLTNPPSLFPGQNILFVGTMNDDESTQSLSDKVLDRGNVMQFPAPTSFPTAAAAAPHVDVDALPFQSWRSWVKAPNALAGAPASRVNDIVGRLAAIMDSFGKPFGFRMNQSIRHYVANYPTEAQIDIDAALIDQIEFRILPKLRGVEIGNHPQQFDELEQLIGETLHDGDLATRLHDLRSDQEGRTGQFVWRGLARD
jgi:predicted  nucleic acid-binding Zn-ribbon protein